jgi:hypothetical protein
MLPRDLLASRASRDGNKRDIGSYEMLHHEVERTN